jgi:thymidylate synthase (FAD)
MSGLSLKDMVYPETVERSTAWEEADGAVGTCLAAYKALIDAGVSPEDARYFLPQASPTRLIVTANFREWRHIIKLRTAPEAQWEIRELVGKIRDKLQEQVPSVFEDLK